MRPRRRSDDRGVVAVWVLVVGAALFAFIAVTVVDGGTVLRTRSRAFSVAGGAARAGAQALEDTAAIQGQIRVDPGLARTAAQTYLDAHDVVGTVAVEGDEVTVTARDTADLDFYPTDIAVSATATAVAIPPPAGRTGP